MESINYNCVLASIASLLDLIDTSGFTESTNYTAPHSQMFMGICLIVLWLILYALAANLDFSFFVQTDYFALEWY